ncbi:hypothetical protein Psch_02071 [Pelotomaculum schinkii]|uniref:Uncharacterized protein n=1 Tax=Pelotomaculum schinkii TaxID=78350 RepID=A0A4Y7RJK0_9FIRM|nr:hypothetical protein [Pelotomaculum schinkii]TEB08507.1 hypothetical protein Psch_02071 [Pelotomaculum schinkii]
MVSECTEESNRVKAIPSLPDSFKCRPWLKLTRDRIIKSALVEVSIPVDGFFNNACVSPQDPSNGNISIFMIYYPELYMLDYSLQKKRSLKIPDGISVGLMSAYSTSGVFFINNVIREPGPLVQVDFNTGSFVNVKTPSDNILGVWTQNGKVWISTLENYIYCADVADIKNWNKCFQTVNTLAAVTWNGDNDNPQYYYITYDKQGTLYRANVETPQDTTIIYETGFNYYDKAYATPDGALWIKKDGKLLLLDGPDGTPTGEIKWYDPFSVNPSGNDEVPAYEDRIALPLTATNILFQFHESSGKFFYRRLGIGVLDQPSLPFPSYTGDELSAYNIISKQLIEGYGNPAPSEVYDIRARYPNTSAAQAAAYLSAVMEVAMPEGFNQAAWDAVQDEIWFELYNLVSNISLWQGMTDLTDLRDGVSQHALNYVSNYLQIPSTATPIQKQAGLVNGLTIAGAVFGEVGSVATGVAAVLSAVALPAGVIAAAAGGVGILLSLFASMEQGWDVKINDQHFTISIVYADLEKTLGPVFASTLDLISQYQYQSTSELGALALSGMLTRSGVWDVSEIIKDGDNSDPNAPVPDNMMGYYNKCCIAYLQAFMPKIAWIGLDHNDNIFADTYWYGRSFDLVSPDGVEYQWCALLQQADDNDKLLGQNIEPLVFDDLKIPPEEIFFGLNGWNMPRLI